MPNLDMATRSSDPPVFVLLIDQTDDYDPPDVHGPFSSIAEAQDYAERWRFLQDLPVEATPENNETWTDAGWYFGIVEVGKVPGVMETMLPKEV